MTTGYVVTMSQAIQFLANPHSGRRNLSASPTPVVHTVELLDGESGGPAPPGLA
jgi:hypothetical protein